MHRERPAPQDQAHDEGGLADQPCCAQCILLDTPASSGVIHRPVPILPYTLDPTLESPHRIVPVLGIAFLYTHWHRLIPTQFIISPPSHHFISILVLNSLTQHPISISFHAIVNTIPQSSSPSHNCHFQTDIVFSIPQWSSPFLPSYYPPKSTCLIDKYIHLSL